MKTMKSIIFLLLITTIFITCSGPYTMWVTNKYENDVIVNYGILHSEDIFGSKDTTKWLICKDSTRKIQTNTYSFLFLRNDLELRTNLITDIHGNDVDVFRVSTQFFKILNFRYSIPLKGMKLDSIFSFQHIEDKYILAQVAFINGSYKKCIDELLFCLSFESTYNYYNNIYKNSQLSKEMMIECINAIRRGSLFLSYLSAIKLNDLMLQKTYKTILTTDYKLYYDNTVRHNLELLSMNEECIPPVLGLHARHSSTTPNTQMQLHSRWSFRPDGKWISQCSHMLQRLFRNSSSAYATLDLQNNSFSQRFEHRLNHFCSL